MVRRIRQAGRDRGLFLLHHPGSDRSGENGLEFCDAGLGADRSGYRGSGSPLVSRPKYIAMMLRKAKQVITAVTRLKLPPKAPTRSPATSGPKLVMMRAEPVQKPTAVERIWVGNSSGR